MGKRDKDTEGFPKERRDARQHGENTPGGDRSRRRGRDREQDDWKIHPREDSPPEWDEEDRPDA
ncbi:hypothetical protein [Streptomyces megasporus]|uniref:hypothetical protein n=1 Tax=Streptomyces megasporus TaxID=44060 RepID=UPI0004E0C022|nr:hypothetical protein [Streptomyces megasporus]